MLLCICSIIHQNVVIKNKTVAHELLGECVTDVLTVIDSEQSKGT